ncbi:helix-turn-helix domain-containing protein [Actinomycetospora sp. TBRC 11914]|uniref:winged helix-turn-helix transcriptional regulator n=1 Tax=Actinomycetospora sp. TBRC 11914 TaxID=2729387 RepID=UPI00145D3860|nr:helix-turn-helix domain-containing protein [Actinomycetospora sp. TBRC 11914]NMO92144.1 helix-turn-helix transcriptional regulator [Actinomycetospora sp. TBRC 11914]
MSRYGQYCPITRALEILGDRWTLLVVRDLLVGATRFNELARGLPGMSRGLLSKRLAHLERHGLVERVEDGYRPTTAGEELRGIVFGLGEWGARWAFGEPRPDELDPTVLMWWIRGGIDPAPFGRPRVVLHVRVPDGRRTRYWFVVLPHDVSLCFTDPGHEPDVVLDAPLGVLYQFWLGRLDLLAAAREGLVSLTGRRAVLERLPEALRLSPVASYVREARDGAGVPVPS